MIWTLHIEAIEICEINTKYWLESFKQTTWEGYRTWENNIKMDLKRNSMWCCRLYSSGSGYVSLFGGCEN